MTIAGGIVWVMIYLSKKEGGELHIPTWFQHGWHGVIWMLMILVGIFCALQGLFMFMFSGLGSLESDGSFGGKEGSWNDTWYL